MTQARPGIDRAAWQRARRAVARRHHPDLGGDLATYLRLLAEVDRRHGFTHRAGSRPAHVTLDRRRRALVRRSLRARVQDVHRLVRALRGRLPRGVPGRRRYTSL